MKLAIQAGLRYIHLAAIFILLIADAANADFVTFQADNQRTGNVSGTGPQQPNLLWSMSPTGHGIISAAPAISGERLYVPNWPASFSRRADFQIKSQAK